MRVSKDIQKFIKFICIIPVVIFSTIMSFVWLVFAFIVSMTVCGGTIGGNGCASRLHSILSLVLFLAIIAAGIWLNVAVARKFLAILKLNLPKLSIIVALTSPLLAVLVYMLVG